MDEFEKITMIKQNSQQMRNILIAFLHNPRLIRETTSSEQVSQNSQQKWICNKKREMEKAVEEGSKAFEIFKDRLAWVPKQKFSKGNGKN